MYSFGQIRSFIFCICICSTTVLADPIAQIGQDRAEARQFPQLSFALPALGFIGGQSRSNIFAKSTVTRTILSTVSTITAASFRTCTTTMAALMPCAGRRRRRGVGSGENEIIDPSPSMRLSLGTMVISDPAAVAEFLSQNPPPAKSEVDMDNIKETTTMFSVERSLDGTTILYPSVDEVGSNDDVLLVGDSKDESGITTETPYSDNLEITTLDSIQQDNQVEDDKARAGLGGVVTTVTSNIPITHVVQTAATGTMATLSITYAGCAPPSFPVVGLMCT